MQQLTLLLMILWSIIFKQVNSYTTIVNSGSTWFSAVGTCQSHCLIAVIKNPKQYREMVRYLETHDHKIGYYIGVEWKNKQMQDIKGNVIDMTHMPLLQKAVPLGINKGKEYGIYWRNGQFHNIKKKSKRKHFEIVVQTHNDYKILAKYEYFLWAFFEQTHDSELLSLERKNEFPFKEFNGAKYIPKLNQFQFKGHKWVIEMDRSEMDKLKHNIKLHGGNADALHVQNAYLTSLTKTNIIKKVSILIRGVDISKSILYVNNGQNKNIVYNIFKPINTMSLDDILTLCQHEYIFNLVESQIQSVKNTKLTNIDDKLLNHKGLVIIQGDQKFRKYFDDPKYFVIHARNLDKTIQKQEKDHAFKLRLDELPHTDKILTAVDMIITADEHDDEHDEQDNEPETNNYILWKMVNYKAENKGTVNEYGLAHVRDEHENNELFIFASVHNLPESAQMIKEEIAEKEPNYVFLEIDAERMAETFKEQEESDFGNTFDYAISNNNVDKIILADYDYHQFTPWMFLRRLLVFDHKLLPSITVAGIYFDVFVNMRNHLMISTINNFIQMYDIHDSKLWITVGKIHWAKGKDADPIYSIDMKDLMTDGTIYQSLQQPIILIENEENDYVTLEFELFPYTQVKETKVNSDNIINTVEFKNDLWMNLKILVCVILVGCFIGCLCCFIVGLICGFYYHRKK
eukprot:298569_1